MDYASVLSQMAKEGFSAPVRRFTFALPNAKEELQQALSCVANSMGEQLQWLPEYDEVAAWLSDNKGKGLFLFGSCGRGKSLLTRYALPMIFRAKLNRSVKVVDCAYNGVNIDEVVKYPFLALDDLGAEEDVVNYGTKRQLVSEVICRAQDNPKMFVIASSNYDGEALRERYGERVLDRMKYLFYQVSFNGKSLRK